MHNKEKIDRLRAKGSLTKEEFVSLLSSFDGEDREYAAELAREVSAARFGREVYLRALIECTNYCKNDCYYCGIRRSNESACRYRLSREDIMACCDRARELGFRTFVLQGGEDPVMTDDRVCEIISAIHEKHSDCAITLSVGEKSRASYQRYFDCGANRYLLRHETADAAHYRAMHPEWMSHENRMRCLRDLKDIGYQVGCGCMVGSPFQTVENLADDLLFMLAFRPHMIGIGPFIPAKNTPFADRPAGSVRLTLFLLSLIRLMHPDVLLPATTALGTLTDGGREAGVLAGANVVMPNVSPPDARKKYLLYDNKLGANDETGESLRLLKKRLADIGYAVSASRGDYGERSVHP